MRTIEVRRHSHREKPNPHLSQSGVNLARVVGSQIGPFARVVTSREPRAIETAIAMGYAVQETRKELGPGHLSKTGPEVDFALGFAGWAKAVQLGKGTRRFARKQRKLWALIAKELPDGESALIIGHEGIAEAGAVECFPDRDHAAWGPNCGFCEGVRLTFDGKRFTDIVVLRVEPDGSA
ncbi:phosphoglycerate mutase family protein [Candidatus Poribacteria bacterium]|nr:phosphoglycerate mutase family protein [Candidatus Poribacteria bacterium]